MDKKTIIARSFLYHCDLACLDINDCANKIVSNYQFETKEELVSVILSCNQTKITCDLDALKYLLRVSAESFSFGNEYYLDNKSIDAECIESTYESVIKEYKNINLSLSSYPDIELVENYPFPYENNKGVALAPDQTDRERYHIPYSIFIRKESVDPTILPVIIAHELIHYFVKDCGLLARGLEEGLADFFAFFVVGPKILHENVLRRYFISKRLNPNSVAPKFRTYLDYVRVCLFLASFYGLPELVKLVNSGRRNIKIRENMIINGHDLPSNSPRAHFCQDTGVELDFAWRTINNHPIFEFVSARAYFLIQNHKNPKLLKRLGADISILQKEIEQNIFGCVVGTKNQLEFEDFETLSKSNALRFELR